jgi:hypothetical protein
MQTVQRNIFVVGDFDLYAEKETTGEHLFHVTLSQ